MNSQRHDQTRNTQTKHYYDRGISHDPKEALHVMLNDMLRDLPDIENFDNLELQLHVVQPRAVATREIYRRGDGLWHLESNINFGDES